MRNTLDSLTFHPAPGSVLFKALAAEMQWGRSHLGCHRYLHSSFHPEWRGSPRYTRSGSCRPCWCSGHCCRSGHSADTRQCLGLKWERMQVIWRTWNYFLSPSIFKFWTLILYFNYLIISIIIYIIPNNKECGIISIRKKKTFTWSHPLLLSLRLLRPQLYKVFSIFPR